MLEGQAEVEGEGSGSSSGSSSGSYTSSSEEEVSEDKDGQLDMARQLDADLAAMETEEEPIANADVEMAEQEVVVVQNAPPPTGQEEVPVPEAEVAPREENPQRISHVMLSISLRNLLSTMKLLVRRI